MCFFNDMNATVAIVRCESYRANLVEAAVRRGIDLLGGIGAFAAKGERILLKPNALWATDPEKCVVTHPEVFGAVARLLARVTGNRGNTGDFIVPDRILHNIF